MSEATTLTPPTTPVDEEALLDAAWREAQPQIADAPPVETRTDASPDAAPATPADAGVDTSAFDAEYDAILKQEAEGKEGQEAKAPESRIPAGPDPAVVEQGRQQARALHAQKQADLDAYEAVLIEADVAPALATRLVKEMKDKLNELYAGILPLAGYEQGFQVEQRHHAAFMEGLAKPFGGAETPSYQAFWKGLETMADPKTGTADYATVLRHFADTLYKGFKSPEDYEAYGKNRYNLGRSNRERIGTAASNPNNGVTGTPSVITGGKGKAWYEALTADEYDKPENQADIRAYEMGAMAGAR